MMYDFYYSAEHDAHMENLYKYMGKVKSKCYINGKKYTEMIKTGKTPTTSNFKDLTFICTEEEGKIKVFYQ